MSDLGQRSKNDLDDIEFWYMYISLYLYSLLRIPTFISNISIVSELPTEHFPVQMHNEPNLTFAWKGQT